MVRQAGRRQKGFTLLELLIVLAIIGILWGVGLSVMPRILTNTGPAALARGMVGDAQEARQMAMLQQRPWELLIDLDESVIYRSPLGAVVKWEERIADELDDDATDSFDTSTPIDPGYLLSDATRGELTDKELTAQRQDELELQFQPLDSLRVIRNYDRLAFSHNDTLSDISEYPIPEDVRIIQVWKKGDIIETAGRISIVFGPRGFVQPTAVWLEDPYSSKNACTIYFSGIMPPLVIDGLFLPDQFNLFTPTDQLP